MRRSERPPVSEVLSPGVNATVVIEAVYDRQVRSVQAWYATPGKRGRARLNLSMGLNTAMIKCTSNLCHRQPIRHLARTTAARRKAGMPGFALREISGAIEPNRASAELAL